MEWLKRHPFPVVAHFDRVLAVSFAFPERALRPLLPPQLTLDSHQGLGFVTVALVWTRQMRPAGFPAFLGRDFFLAGYRIFAQFHDATGRTRRGLYILRSETNSPALTTIGNLTTRYAYRRVQPTIQSAADGLQVETTLPNGQRTLQLAFGPLDGRAALPATSPFADWKTARKFAGPMRYTFSVEQSGRIVVIEGARQSWEPRPVEVRHWEVELFQTPPFWGTHPLLANAFTTEAIDYRWERGELATAQPSV